MLHVYVEYTAYNGTFINATFIWYIIEIYISNGYITGHIANIVFGGV